MSEALTVKGPWDKPDPHNELTYEQKMHIVTEAPTCVFIRLRSDGHPIGAVVAAEVIDGEIYTSTNLFRAAYKNILRDERCCATFDIPLVASVSVIGRAEIIHDPATVRRFFEVHAHRAPAVLNDGMPEDVYVETAFTDNRRLFHIMPEKMFGSSLAKLQGLAQQWPKAD